MPDWFVYQRDVFPRAMDPDALGTMLVPEYDTHNNVVYRDKDTPEMNGLRRVKTYWGVDPHIVQYDIVVHASTAHSQGEVLTVHWFPRTERFAFKNLNNGFSFENPTQRLCLYVARDAHDDTNHATLMRYDPATHTYTTMVGVVVGIRVHTLTLFAPGSASWFAEQVTAKTSSSVVLPPRVAPAHHHHHHQQHAQPHTAHPPPPAPSSSSSSYHHPPHIARRRTVHRCGDERVTSPTPFFNHTAPDGTATAEASELAHYHSALRDSSHQGRCGGDVDPHSSHHGRCGGDANPHRESLTFSTASSSLASACSTTATTAASTTIGTTTQPTTASTITHPTASPRPTSPVLPRTPAQEVANRNKLL